MALFQNLRISVKLGLAFGLMIALAGMVGYLGFAGVVEVGDQMGVRYQQEIASFIAIQDAQILQLRSSRALRNTLLAQEMSERKAQKADCDKFVDQTIQQLTKAQGMLTDRRAKEEMAKAMAALPAWRDRDRDASALAAQGETARAAARMKSAAVENEALRSALVKLLEIERELAAEANARGAVASDRTRKSLLGWTSAALALALVLGWVLTRMICRPIRSAVAALEAVAGGDFSQRVVSAGKDELGVMVSSLDKALERMRTLVSNMKQLSEGLQSASHELTAASEALAQNAQADAATQHESSATLKNLSSTVSQNAERARVAAGLARESQTVAAAGGGRVDHATTAIEEAAKASRSVAAIIDTVDEIAFQTNLLALNAAVEAARAGDHGRGFAVVASEVGLLARRSAEASKQVSELIQASLGRVETGAKLVKDSGGSLRTILDSVQRMVSVAADISQASQEQAVAIDAASRALAEMDRSIHGTASQSEELAAMAASLSESARQMAESVRAFRVS